MQFNESILGLHLPVETDGEPLVPILGTTEFYKVAPCILRFHLRLMRTASIYRWCTLTSSSRSPIKSWHRAHCTDREFWMFCDTCTAFNFVIPLWHRPSPASRWGLLIRQYAYCTQGLPIHPLVSYWWNNDWEHPFLSTKNIRARCAITLKNAERKISINMTKQHSIKCRLDVWETPTLRPGKPVWICALKCPGQSEKKLGHPGI